MTVSLVMSFCVEQAGILQTDFRENSYSEFLQKCICIHRFLLKSDKYQTLHLQQYEYLCSWSL
jgi:hypothetical protein